MRRGRSQKTPSRRQARAIVSCPINLANIISLVHHHPRLISSWRHHPAAVRPVRAAAQHHHVLLLSTTNTTHTLTSSTPRHHRGCHKSRQLVRVATATTALARVHIAKVALEREPRVSLARERGGRRTPLGLAGFIAEFDPMDPVAEGQAGTFHLKYAIMQGRITIIAVRDRAPARSRVGTR